MGQLRRKLSVAAVKAQSSSLLGRLDGLGPGMGLENGRRQEVLERSRILERERQIHSQALRQSHSIVRRGFAKVN